MAPNISLKQRLAALSIAPSSPTAPHGSNATPKSPSRRKFNAPWARRNTNEQVEGDPGARDRVQDVMSKLIFQAGVDYETRPMVVLNASALPDPREVDYDILLSRILAYLNLYVESDYTVVFFAAGGRHTPGWNWVWKAYRSLSRKYRKNLKRLYIVHSTFFSKMLFSLAGAIISPKFFRKLEYINTLSELAHQVPLTQIDIPPAVYQENSKQERQITLPVPTRSSVFGVPLEELMGFDGDKGGVPRVVKDCIQYLRETGLDQDGLFRRSPNSLLLRQIQDAYDRGNVVSMDTIGDPHLAAVLLKKFLRDLPQPIFKEAIYPVIRRCPPPNDDPADISAVAYIRDTLLSQLDPCVYIVLSHYLHLMHEVSLRSSTNRMDAHNLAVVLCPNLVSGPDPLRDVMMCAVPAGPALQDTPAQASASPPEGRTTIGAVIKLCIQRYYEVFDEVPDRTEAVARPRPRVPSNQPSPAGSFSSASRDRPHSGFPDDDEEIDDAMLVMSIGPSGSGSVPNGGAKPAQQAAPATSTWSAPGPVPVPYAQRVRGGRSIHATADGTVNGAVQSTGKARSMISIDNGRGLPGSRKGSISIGRGATRKSSGAGVEAIGVTAGGFFSPPSSAPPVPARKSAS
ncbi:CDC42 rho GTPase-activating protein [Athelia psychrophila]|uniref:CDC42 rho GTPase-activating protein n=1 Tax=Athelia psychrophila TaxID=1759441 RepID=A0A166LUD4_9AGAM|nr:CDC42 rho GTPase-activating protein [Fibularhizoctonia sp. CBS 109695]